MKVTILYLLLLSQLNFDAFFVDVPLLLSYRAGCRTDLLCVGMKFTPDYNNIVVAIDISPP